MAAIFVPLLESWRPLSCVHIKEQPAPIIDGARDLTNRNHRSYSDGLSLWFWSCQLPIHFNGSFHEAIPISPFTFHTSQSCTSSYRPVTHADIQIVERKLMQTMDMIVVKKKRIAVIERDAGSRKNRQIAEGQSSSVWSMLKSVGLSSSSGSESMS